MNDALLSICIAAFFLLVLVVLVATVSITCYALGVPLELFRIDQTSTQDLSPHGGKDEKPDRPFA